MPLCCLRGFCPDFLYNGRLLTRVHFYKHSHTHNKKLPKANPYEHQPRVKKATRGPPIRGDLQPTWRSERFDSRPSLKRVYEGNYLVKA